MQRSGCAGVRLEHDPRAARDVAAKRKGRLLRAGLLVRLLEGLPVGAARREPSVRLELIDTKTDAAHLRPVVARARDRSSTTGHSSELRLHWSRTQTNAKASTNASQQSETAREARQNARLALCK